MFFGPQVRALAGQICQNPIIIDLKGKDAVPETGAGGWPALGIRNQSNQ